MRGVRSQKTKGGGPHGFVSGGAYHARRAERQQEVNETIAAWRALPAKEKLRELDRRHGAGKGAGRQRARLAKELAHG